MLKLYNKEHVAIGALTNLKDYKIEYVLSGEDLVKFSLSISDENIHLVEEEGYVRNKNNEYVIKAIDPSDNFKIFTCNVNVEDLVGKAIANFDTSNNKLDDTIRLAIAGTGWILVDSGITKRRTVRLTNTNALEVLREVRKVFSVDFRYDAINKKIYVYEKFGEDKGVYFSDELNLKSFSIPSDTYDYVTRLYPYGKDGLNISSVNNGKKYIENFQYSSKVIELIWEDNRYTVAENLLEDAKAKLDELSKPNRSYQTSVTDLAKQSDEYSYLDFFLGDTITLLSKQEKFRDKQRIVKYVEYPNDHSQNTCELGNTTLTFEDLQKENEAKNNTVDAITSDNGTVDGSKVDSITTEQISDFEAEVAKITDLEVINANIKNLKAENVTITGKLSAVEGEFGTLKANVGTIDKLTVTHTAQINNLEANKADITELNTVRGEITLLESEVAKIGTLEADVADIEHILAGNITADNIQSGSITAGSGIIADGAIGNAQISSLSANKIDTGEIDTSKVKVKGKDGFLLIENNTLYVTDNNRQIRVELGQIENNTNYGFVVRGADGQTVLLDHNGVRNAGITDGAIDNRTVSESANISGKKLDIDSVIKTINEDGSVKIQGTIVQVGNTTLDVKLSEQNNLITEQGKKLETQQAEITANTNAIKLKVDNQTYQTDKTNMTTQMNKNTSEISAMKGEIALKVEQSDITNAIDNIQVGGRNLFLNSNFIDNSNWTGLPTINKDGNINYIRSSATFITYQKVNVKKGSTYVFSALVRAVNTTPTNFSIKFDTGNYNSTSVNITSTEWTRVSVEIVAKSTQKELIYLCNRGNAGIDIALVKMEEGNKATDWTPAPEDVSAEIETKITDAKAEIKITTDAISQNVSNLTSTVSNKADGSTVNTINNKVGSLETSVNGISGKVSSLETSTTTMTQNIIKAQQDATQGINDAKTANDKATSAQSTANANKNSIGTLQTEVSTVKSNVASLEVTTSGISQKVSSVESTTVTLSGKVTTAQNTADSANNKIDGLQVGGRNLFLNSNFIDNNNWTGLPTINKDGNINYIRSSATFITYQKVNVKKGSTYVFSALVRAVNTTPTNFSIKFNTGNYNSTSVNITSTEWTRVSVEIVAKSTQKELIYLCNRGNAGIDIALVKMEEGNKATDWTPAPEDVDSAITTVESKVETTNSKVATIETNLSSITSRVSNVENTTTTINGNITNLQSRMNSAEQKITDSAIVSTVTSSTTYKNAMTGKVEKTQIISTINQTAESVKINASKIQLEGAVTAGDTDGNYVQIDKGNYTVRDSGQPKAFFGFKNMGQSGYDNYVVPKLAMGAYGYASTHNYLTVVPYRGTDNPESSSSAYADIAYRCLNPGDYSNIKMYDGGNIKIAPVKNLEITTNYLNGNYDSSYERLLARFQTSGYEWLGGHLQVGGISNHNNSHGLVLTDRFYADSWDGSQSNGGSYNCSVRVHTTSTGDKFFRPTYESGKIDLGSGSYRWKTIYSLNAVNVSSDKRLKTDIHYLGDSYEPHTLENRVDTNMNITTQDMYDFIKDDLKLASYRYYANLERGNTATDYGFIAQDILYTKVGSEIVQLEDKSDLDSNLSYNQGNYINTLAGALQEAIKKIEILENKIKELES